MKKCSKCKELKEEKYFYKDKRTLDGLYSSCKDCHNYKRVNKIDKKYHLEYHRKYLKIKENREKSLCRAYTVRLLKVGKIQKTNCVDCGNIKVEAHHEDYSNPREVIWLCKEHHEKLHTTRDRLNKIT